jgi:hypothetical protein
MQFARPAAPRQRQRSATIGQRECAQRALVGLLRIVEQQHTPSRWQPSQTGSRDAFENRTCMPIGVRQDASQAPFDRVGLRGWRHSTELSGDTGQGGMTRQQQTGHQQRQTPPGPHAEIGDTRLQLLTQPLIQ